MCYDLMQMIYDPLTASSNTSICAGSVSNSSLCVWVIITCIWKHSVCHSHQIGKINHDFLNKALTLS